MKRIIISESQLMLLSEAPVIGKNGDINEYPSDAEIGATSNVTDDNGEPQYGDPKTTDKVSDDVTAEKWWRNGNRYVRV